jgi:hypothetical protein
MADQEQQKHERGRSPIIKGFLPGLAERGKIKIGVKGEWIQSGNNKRFQPPQKLDHFRLTTLERDANNNFIEDTALTNLLMVQGEKLTRIPVILLFDDIALNFQCRYSCFVGTSAWCSGDGEYAHRRVDKNTKELKEVTCPCERINFDYEGTPKCKVNGKLSVIIDGAAIVGGVWVFRTTSFNSVQSIYSSLVLIKRITGGPLAGIPMDMVLSPKTAITPDGKTTKIYMVSLEYRGTPQQLRGEGLKLLQGDVEHRKRLELMEANIAKIVMAEFDADDNREFVEEFAPEEAERAGAPEETGSQAGSQTGKPLDTSKEVSQTQTQTQQTQTEQPPASRRGRKPAAPAEPPQTVPEPEPAGPENSTGPENEQESGSGDEWPSAGSGAGSGDNQVTEATAPEPNPGDDDDFDFFGKN